jgi:two-component sensor histidine kinase
LAYTSLVTALGLALLIWSLIRLPAALPEWFLFLGLIIIAELTSSEAIAPQMLFSVSSAVAVATLLLFGPLAAALAYMIGGMVITLAADRLKIRSSRAPLAQRILFNMAARGLSISAAGGIYLLLGGTVGEVALVANLLPLVVAALTNELANAALVIGAVSLQTGQPALEVFRHNVSWAVPIDILVMTVGGAGLAIGYQIAGLLAVAVFFMPLVLTIYSFRMYVARTRAQVEELEKNIEERKHAQEQLSASLGEKVVLLQEIHHRVKNNLQIISALLSLQSEHIKDAETLQMFQESRNRVRSMALVHEKLYESEDLSRIDFGQYIQNLARYLQSTYAVDPSIIKLRIETEEVFLGIDTAVPAGLIVNELFSNSLKHAFPDGREGEICVQFRSIGNGQLVLKTIDNGVGLPQGRDLRDGSSLGLQLVDALVRQIEGRMEMEGNGGTTFTVTFSELEYSG